jgi:23S rRNA (cytosine1962-C5)-methyltransferase
MNIESTPIFHTTQCYPRLFLKPGKQKNHSKKHLWLFSGALQRPSSPLPEGCVVDVYTHDSVFFARGHYHDSFITVRILTCKESEAITTAFWVQALQKAWRVRQCAAIDYGRTNSFRWVHGEGDHLPGLIIDWYNGVAVIQCHTTAMLNSLSNIAEAIQQVQELQECNTKSTANTNVAPVFALKAIFSKDQKQFLYTHPSHNDPTAKPNIPLEIPNATATSAAPATNSAWVHIQENGLQFTVDLENGQKTGFFLDQRENRALVEQYCQGKTVANICGYTGGFSVYALRGGAKEVVTVDVSKTAIAQAEQNVLLNPSQGIHKGVAQDAFVFLQENTGNFDCIILDPPAFSKHRKNKDQALKGYLRLNRSALRHIQPGGIIFTFSCSQVISLEDFKGAVVKAALETGRDIRILQTLSQPADHPVNIYHPESNYLKGLVLYVG